MTALSHTNTTDSASTIVMNTVSIRPSETKADCAKTVQDKRMVYEEVGHEYIDHISIGNILDPPPHIGPPKGVDLDMYFYIGIICLSVILP